jgi:hypothetical protein
MPYAKWNVWHVCQQLSCAAAAFACGRDEDDRALRAGNFVKRSVAS